jgi:hypothetical protein
MKVYWKTAASGDFSTSANWTPYGPGAQNQAMLTATGASYTVSVSSNQTVLTIDTSASAYLDIQNNVTFTAEDGTGPGANNGIIHAEPGSTFEVAGTINNKGTIYLGSSSQSGSGTPYTLMVLLGDTTLNGGALTIFRNGEVTGGGTLTNTGTSEISGAGEIDVAVNNKKTVTGNTTLTPVIDGTSAAQALTLNGVVTNTGELRSEGTAGLTIANTVFNTGGLIDSYSVLQIIDGADIVGGTLQDHTSIFEVVDGGLDGGGTHPISLDGTIDVGAGGTLFTQGVFKNLPSGNFNFELDNGASLLLGFSNATAMDTTLSTTTTGGGRIDLYQATIDLNPLTHAGSTPLKLNNVNDVISGSGTIGNSTTPGSFVLNNETKGTVAADNGTLSIYSNVTNAGVLEAFSGTLSLVGNVVTNTGSLQAASGEVLNLVSTTIRGGTLTGAGTFNAADAVLDGSASALTNAGTIDMAIQYSNEARTLTLKGTINNTGTIELGPSNTSGGSGGLPPLPVGSDLVIGPSGASNTVTLKGSGYIQLDAYGYGNDYIIGDADSPGGVATTLYNLSNIQGSGRIGDGGLTLRNGGTIAATNNNGGPLVIDTGARTVTNTGTLEAVALGGTLYIDSPLNNTGGKLVAYYNELDAVMGATGGTAMLESGGTIEFGGPTTTAVEFLDDPYHSRQLVLDDSVHFKGVISGFDSNKSNLSDSIDLLDIDSATAQKVSYTGGVLTIKDGLGHTTQLHFNGAYTINNFNLNDDGHGGTLLTDPPVVEQKAGNAPATIADGTVLEVKVSDSGKVTFAGPTGTLWLDRPSTFTGKVADFGAQESIDLAGIPFGAHTTLGYSENSSDTGGILSVKNGTHIAKLALLGNYMAASFVTASDGYGGTLITEGGQAAQQSLLTHPRA